MKTTYTIAAIAMFAVILGMSAIAPAMASRSDAWDDGKHKIEFCHYQEAKEAVYETDSDGVTTEVKAAVLEAYLVIETDKKGQMNGHFKNEVAHHFPDEDGDGEIDLDGQGDFLFDSVNPETNEPWDDPENDHDSALDCEAFDANIDRS